MENRRSSPLRVHNRGELDTVIRYQRWEYFGSLTFSGIVPNPRQAVRLVFAHLYRGARALSIPFRHLVWVLRAEHGEIGGRAHYHCLLSTGGKSNPTLGHCFHLNALWDDLPRCGFARHRLYDPKQHGAEYVVQCLSDADTASKNQYELSKFLLTGCDVMLSHSLTREVSGQRVLEDGLRRQERGKKRARKITLRDRWSGRSEWSVRSSNFDYAEIDARFADITPAEPIPLRRAPGALAAKR